MREDRDMTQADLAKLLFCSQATYSHYELGRHDIPTDVLIRLAKIHNTSVDFLLELTDQKEPYPRKNFSPA